MTQPSRIHLFQGYGVELEYMIVDCDTLAVKPVADEVLKHVLGVYGSDYENGMVSWSNELVSHVLELKSTHPEPNLHALGHAFADNVKRINAILASMHACLMPTGMHPFMNPHTETKLWPHDSNEVYALYNAIFDCRGHGWSNVQSTHVNLPFYDDEEFARLHAAIRLVLPIIPALAASSPLVEGKLTGAHDTRLKYYKTNQSRIPSITGRVIPEAVFSKRHYLNTIYEKIKADVAPFDTDHILNPVWVNSRGAIARFDRGSVEIRLLDSQECPAAESAVVTLVVETIKALVNGRFIDHESQMKYRTDGLAQLLDLCVEKGEQAIIRDPYFLKIYGITNPQLSAAELWQHIFDTLSRQSGQLLQPWKPELEVIFQEGTLATRIIRALQGNASPDAIRQVYHTLCDCLAQNKPFIP
jgi:gamma-glutamyl:cysteine ligase YbdK (ATP-grasp superfamily)